MPRKLAEINQIQEKLRENLLDQIKQQEEKLEQKVERKGTQLLELSKQFTEKYKK